MTTWIRHTPEAEALFSEERLVLSATELVHEAIAESGLSKKDLAKLIGVRPSEISQRLSGHRNLTLRSLARMMHALGYELSFEMRRRSSADRERANYETMIGRRVSREVAEDKPPTETVRNYFVVLTFKAYPLDELEKATDALQEALMTVAGISDPDVTVSLETGRVDVAMYVEAGTKFEAISRAENALAEAIHRSGALQDWEERAEEDLREDRYRAEVQPADLLTV
ncbi:helix-turn-helix domain-containing protein [Nocardia brevicatena]|uniref:helix-turn-helix domain-containing protein n=1 Tax=Nocardia brevicatena TaxID=37327 RepID=UPI0005944DA2|nr:helix-turn-helix transcriptional regulator [Nocardia brevicatena]